MADGKKADRVTIRTVAADAGVSVAAVSKVLRSAYGVSDALRVNVLQSIARLGYRPNVAARGMRGSTYTLGILLSDLANPFLPQIIEGINAVAEPAGYKAMIGVGQSNVPIETRMIESMIDYRMDGLILVAPRLGPETLPAYAAQIPIVAIGHHEPDAPGFDTVNADDRMGAALVVAAFRARGHQNIGMISLDLGVDHHTNVSDLREDGYLAAMAAAGLAHMAQIRRLELNSPRSQGQLAAWLDAPDRPRAVFCWSDLHAVDLRNMAAAKGIAVPQDLAIAGFDNTYIAALPLIDLTSVDQAGTTLGRGSAELLLARIAGRRVAEHRLIAPHLILRGSH